MNFYFSNKKPQIIYSIKMEKGFTLVEILIAMLISGLVIAAALSSFIYGLKAWKSASIQAELQMDLERAIEHIRKDLRLSSVGIGLMSFYPTNATEYTAISFPLATPTTNGMLPRTAQGKILWDKTVIYHIRPGSPDELRRTVFFPRNTNATPADLYAQLEAVVKSTDDAAIQAAAMPGESATTEVIFKNLVKMTIQPPVNRFDGYAVTNMKAKTVNLGSIVLSKGFHDLTFTVLGKNPNSTGYKVGIDKFQLSYSGSPREGETYVLPNTHPTTDFFSYSNYGGTVIAEDMSIYGTKWSGNCQLTFIAAAPNQSITFKVYNDLWCDANFDAPPPVAVSNVVRKWETLFSGYPPNIPDIVVVMDKGINWMAEWCTDGSFQNFSIPVSAAIVNVIYGGTNLTAANRLNGVWARFKFAAGTNGNLFINNPWIGIQASGASPVSGSQIPITFSGIPRKKILAGTEEWSDWINLTNSIDLNYLVGFTLQSDSEVFNNSKIWQLSTVGATLSYIDSSPTNAIIGLSAMEVRYPDRGIYRSGIFDTHVANPTFKTLRWTHLENFPDGDIDIRVRCADLPDMSDAGAWLPAGGYFQNCLNNSLLGLTSANGTSGRYIQYEALFTTDGDPPQPHSAHTNTAYLRDVTIDWDPPTGLVDLLVDFGKGPDYGIVYATVDGEPLIKGIVVDLEIFKAGPYGTNTVSGTFEICPLNTGK